MSIRVILDALKRFVGEQALALILAKLLTKDNILKTIDAILDIAEDLAEKTKTSIDDKALKKIREALSIPD